MSVSKLSTNLNFVSQLGDTPNTDNNMSASELKAVFDKAGQTIKDYINNTLVPAVNAVMASTDGIADSDYPECYYRTVDGVKEWINPPMMQNPGIAPNLEAGYEYRTAERYGGKPVYVQRIITAATTDITGATGTWSSFGVEHGIDGIETVLRCTGYWGGDAQLPYFSVSDGELTTAFIQGVTATKVFICTNKAWAKNRFGYFTIYYTKE